MTEELAVGFAGLGAMGSGMAVNLVRHGFAVMVYDIDPAAIARVVEQGATAAPSAADLALSDVVVLMLPHPEVTRTVVLGPDGFGRSLRRGAVIIDAATDGPEIVRELAAELQPAGIDVIDAPVGRGVDFAARGELMLMVGGEDASITRAQSVLDAMSSEIVRCGPLGSGQVVKLANNLVSVANVAVVAEAAALARTYDVPEDLLARVLTRTAADSWQLRNSLQQRVPRGDFSLGFKTALALKDLRLAASLGATQRVGMPVTEASIDWYDRACSAGFADEDQSRVTTMAAPSRP